MSGTDGAGREAMNLDGKPDAELVQLFKSGDPHAFDALVQRFQDRVYRLAAVCLYDTQQADDAVQEVFLRAYTGLRGFRFRAAPFTWLYRTTRLVCNEFNRRKRPDALAHEPVDDAATPDSVVAGLETARRVRGMVAGLPARQREVVMLRMFEELSVAETARAMGCRQGTVKALLHKATTRLKRDNPGMEVPDG